MPHKWQWKGEGVPLAFPEIGSPRLGDIVEVPDALVEPLHAAGFIDAPKVEQVMECAKQWELEQSSNIKTVVDGCRAITPPIKRARTARGGQE